MIVITRIFNVLSVLHTVEFNNHLKMKIERIVWEKILKLFTISRPITTFTGNLAFCPLLCSLDVF